MILATLVFLMDPAGCRRQPGLVLTATLRTASRDFKREGVTLTVRETASIQRIAASGIRRASAVSAAMPPLPATCDNV